MNIKLQDALKVQFHKNADLKQSELNKQLKWLAGNFKTEREKQAYISGFEQGFGILDVQDRQRVYCENVR